MLIEGSVPQVAGAGWYMTTDFWMLTVRSKALAAEEKQVAKHCSLDSECAASAQSSANTKSRIRASRTFVLCWCCSTHFSCSCLTAKIILTVSLFFLNPHVHWLSETTLSTRCSIILFKRTRARILPAMLRREYHCDYHRQIYHFCSCTSAWYLCLSDPVVTLPFSRRNGRCPSDALRGLDLPFYIFLVGFHQHQGLYLSEADRWLSESQRLLDTRQEQGWCDVYGYQRSPVPPHLIPYSIANWKCADQHSKICALSVNNVSSSARMGVMLLDVGP